jgi:hypothetical protein
MLTVCEPQSRISLYSIHIDCNFIGRSLYSIHIDCNFIGRIKII